MQVHESFRSENILFFASHKNDTDAGTETDVSGNVDLTQPWVFGFEFSRPDSFFSAGFIDSCPDRDVYRHPERQGQPLTTFKKIHDIYALGIVLLEIGKPYISVPQQNDPKHKLYASRLMSFRDLATCGHAGKESICPRSRLTRAALRNHAAFDEACSKAFRESDGVQVPGHSPEMHQWGFWGHRRYQGGPEVAAGLSPTSCRSATKDRRHALGGIGTGSANWLG